MATIERRYKVLEIKGLPDLCIVKDVNYESDGTLLVKLQHESFEDIPPGQMIPTLAKLHVAQTVRLEAYDVKQPSSLFPTPYFHQCEKCQQVWHDGREAVREQFKGLATLTCPACVRGFEASYGDILPEPIRDPEGTLTPQQEQPLADNPFYSG